MTSTRPLQAVRDPNCDAPVRALSKTSEPTAPLAPSVVSWRTGRRRSAKLASAHMEARCAIERSAGHLDAIYLLAYLYAGNRVTADGAVVDAVAGLLHNPAAPTAGPVWVWRILADRIHAQLKVEPDCPRSLTAPIPPSSIERECIALVGAGRPVCDVAALLGMSASQAQRNINRGLRDMREGPSGNDHLAGLARTLVDAPAARPSLRLVAETRSADHGPDTRVAGG